MGADLKIICDNATFDGLKCRKDFGHLLALARAVNALSYVQDTFNMGDSPSQARARINMFLFQCSVLCECLKLVYKMQDVFGNNSTFNAGLRLLLNDPVAVTIRDVRMKRVRDRGTYHFDPKEFKKKACLSPSQECKFTIVRGNIKGERYYDFADALVLDMFVRPLDGGADLAGYTRIAQDRIPEVRDLASRFVAMADTFINECLKGWGFSAQTA
jgi:hypothetical protein